jgi:toxin FitB
MSFLVDATVVAELRKGQRTDPQLAAWYRGIADEDLHLSVLTVGALGRAVEAIRRRDPRAAAALATWLGELTREHPDRLLPVDAPVVEAWARFDAPGLGLGDGLLAATAKVHGLTLVSRRAAQIAPTGVPCLNPFQAPEARGRRER